MESLGKLAEALAKAQGELTHAAKDSRNPHYNSTYASLTAVLDASLKTLSNHGIACAQPLEFKDGIHFVVTTLIHTSGEVLKSYYPLLIDPGSMHNPQKLGSAVTYARRYSLAAMVGIGQEDLDANDVSIEQHPKEDVTHHNDPLKTSVMATFRIPIGKKYKGKTFDEVGPQELSSFIGWLKDEAQKNKKPLQGSAKQTVMLAEEYLSGVSKQAKTPQDLVY